MLLVLGCSENMCPRCQTSPVVCVTVTATSWCGLVLLGSYFCSTWGQFRSVQ